jgi:hypothetical protein
MILRSKRPKMQYGADQFVTVDLTVDADGQEAAPPKQAKKSKISQNIPKWFLL